MIKEVTRPALRYHGGKWRLAPWIISNFPPHRVYVEPFGGGASVLLRKPRSYAEVYNDLDGEVVNLFRILRDSDGAKELKEQVALTPYSRYEHIAAYEYSNDPIEMARRLLVRSFMGHGSNGINRKTGFRSNVTRGGGIPVHNWADFPSVIPDLSARMAGVIIENRPAAEVIAGYDAEDVLFYVDPPYVHETRGGNGAYRHEMTDDQHRELAAVLHEVRGMVIVSGYPCVLYDNELYADWTRVERKSSADDHTERTEVLWMNAACDMVTPQMQFEVAGMLGEKDGANN